MKPIGDDVLHRAVAKLGPLAVAAKLDISPAALERYLSGERQVSDSMLLKVIDLVMDAESKH